MMGTFGERIQTLRDNVGGGEMVGNVEVDQRYAADQHFHDEYKHPDGGKAYYLRDPLYAKESDFMEHLAEKLLEGDGKEFSSAMMDNMESLSQGVYDEAPWEFADLRASGHPSVTVRGELVHDRAPQCPRLSDGEIAEKRKLSQLIQPDRYGANDGWGDK